MSPKKGKHAASLARWVSESLRASAPAVSASLTTYNENIQHQEKSAAFSLINQRGNDIHIRPRPSQDNHRRPITPTTSPFVPSRPAIKGSPDMTISQHYPHESMSSFVQKYKLPLIGVVYCLATGGAFWRISRQPCSKSMKWGQYETVFKGTTLAAVVGGIAVSGGANRRRSGEHWD